MGKFYKKKFHLQAVIKESNSDIEDLNFIEEELKHKSKSNLVREAISTLRKHRSGKLYQKELKQLKDAVENINVINKFEEIKKLLKNVEIVEDKDSEDSKISKQRLEKVVNETDFDFDFD